MKYIFGPVLSRRLGYSLGVDIIPLKTCTLNCIYCQLGETPHCILIRKPYGKVEEIIRELKISLEREKKIDWITLSGSGEPTLNSLLGNIIREIKKISSIPVAVITNGTLFYLPEVREGLRYADLVIPSIDAASEEVFQRINRPPEGLKLEKVISGLLQFRKDFPGEIWLEIMLVRGVNHGEEELTKIKDIIQRLSPERVHLNTPVRPPAEDWVTPLSYEELKRIKEFLGDRVEIIVPSGSGKKHQTAVNLEKELFAILLRRPETIEGILSSLGGERESLERIMEKLLRERKIKKFKFGEKIYYLVRENIYN